MLPIFNGSFPLRTMGMDMIPLPQLMVTQEPSNMFADSAEWMCGSTTNAHCIVDSFAVVPVTLLFVLMAPFMFYDQDVPNHASRKVAWSILFPQWAVILQALVCVVLAFVPLVVAILQAEGNIPEEAGAEHAAVLAALAGLAGYLLAAATLLFRATGPVHRTRGIPDWILWWFIFCFVAELAALSISTSQEVSQGHADTLDSVSIAHTVLLGVFLAIPAAWSLLPTWTELKASCSCSRRSETADAADRSLLSGAASSSAAAYGSLAGDASAAAAAAAGLSGMEAAGASPPLSPEEQAGTCSRLLFAWVSPLMMLGYARPLERADLPGLSVRDSTDTLQGLFRAQWDQELNYARAIAQGQRSPCCGCGRKARPASGTGSLATAGAGAGNWDASTPLAGESVAASGDSGVDWRYASVLRALMRAHGGLFYAAVILKTIYDLLQFVGPQVLSAVIHFLEDVHDDVPGVSMGVGYGYAAVMFGVSIIQSLVLHQYFFRVFLAGQHLRSAVISSVYRKSLRLSIAARQEQSTGVIVNLMSTDATRMRDLTTYLLMIWSAPLQIVLAVTFLWQQIGPSVFAGIAVMILFIPINFKIAQATKRLQTTLMGLKDKRVNATSEALNGIKLIKLYAWEAIFGRRIQTKRDLELKKLWSYTLLVQISMVMWGGLPLLVALASFGAYVGAGNQLTAAKAFTSLSLFTLLRFPLTMLPSTINNCVEASISLARIHKFLTSEEVDPAAINRLPRVPGGEALAVEEGEFEWGADAPAEGDDDGDDDDDDDDDDDKDGQRAGDDEADGSSDKKQSKKKRRTGGGGGGDSKQAEPLLGAASTGTSGAGGNDNDDDLEAGSAPDERSGRLTVPQFSVRDGELVAVVGETGAGKSTLLHAALGELHKLSGSVTVRGSVALAAQSPFVLNATVRDNILFGQPLDLDRYHRVIDVCQLQADLDMLDAGDQTEIGERGINLSGGQKARVSLARAVYSTADVLLLDDILSAVDPHVGNEIFKRCIQGMLADRTVVLVTHAMQFTRHCDRIVGLEAGRVVESGTFAELAQRPSSVLSRLMETHMGNVSGAVAAAAASAAAAATAAGDDGDEDEAAGSGEEASLRRVRLASQQSNGSAYGSASHVGASQKPGAAAAGGAEGSSLEGRRTQEIAAGKQTAAERMERGSVASKVYWQYLEALGGPWVGVVIMAGFALTQATQVVSSWFLGYWSDQTADRDVSTRVNLGYLGSYAAISFGAIVVSVLARIFVTWAGVKAAGDLHEGLVSGVLRAYQAFFDTTPVGRILNRFSQDTYTIDEALITSFSSFLTVSFAVLSTFVVISAATPAFIALFVPLAIFFYFAQRYYVATSRQLQRLTSTAQSPIYSHFGETVQGIVTIRAFGDSPRFIGKSDAQLDANQTAYFCYTSGNRWLAVRLEIIAGFTVLGATLFAVVAAKTINPSVAGLSINYALSITQALNWMVRQASQVETQIVAVERVREYSRLANEPTTGRVNPPKDWPQEGRIEIRDLRMRYRKTTPEVLRGVSLDVPGRSKVGICGRTGSGKSSFISSLFRLPEVQQGRIEIDGVDIADVPLPRLRDALAIIPQDAFLWSTTVRENLDPDVRHSDEEIWEALRQVRLDDKVSSLGDMVKEGGENFSHGQRQLLCIARALLRKCRVVVLDEATSSVDVTTDGLLQEAIRSGFADATVLTIAHRLNTILDSDRILVLNAGKVAEYDSPVTLQATADSEFADMLREATAHQHAEAGSATGEEEEEEEEEEE